MMSRGQKNVRPHPGPLPQERENYRPFSNKANRLCSAKQFVANEQSTAVAIHTNKFSRNGTSLSLSRGERAGVRASVGSNIFFSA